MKRDYSAPQMVDLGDVRTITQKSGSGFIDAITGTTTNPDGTTTITGTIGSSGCIPDHPGPAAQC
jgi:hypothetical protein